MPVASLVFNLRESQVLPKGEDNNIKGILEHTFRSLFLYLEQQELENQS